MCKSIGHVLKYVLFQKFYFDIGRCKKMSKMLATMAYDDLVK